ncbi:Uu.00g022490.m01.CDS01 [Anthostomella pinea]|uniref:Uu.00g022490.m01.CDS01 n=1 Tax=Anthostomella pinea TaxID=933095 RepID=A0AAI8W0S9_9PEZI|nr:Uu.00g022490.m01.CDS01 [Anthostomella pinea]
MVELSPEFKTAQLHSRQLVAKPEDKDLLELYGLFKVSNAEDISKAEKPGMFDMKGKFKMSAWQKIVDEGITPEQAQERYVKKIEELKGKHGFDENKAAEPLGSRA